MLSALNTKGKTFFLSLLKNQIKGGRWKLLEVMDKFMALSVVIVSQVILISKLSKLHTLSTYAFSMSTRPQ